MSYDLFFYKHKTNNLTFDQIGDYLSNNLVNINEQGNQWFFENEDTEVYYSFEENLPEEEEEAVELSESFKDFDNTNISFNLNFIRPCFFGHEAFNFVEKFIKDLDLYVVNPQGEDGAPYKPTREFLFKNWNKTNDWAVKEHFDETSLYYPTDKSNTVWEHNYHRQTNQKVLGEEYFISKIFFFKQLNDKKVVTLSMWTQHIPNVLPITDYYLLGREYKKSFRTIKDSVLLAKSDFNKTFGDCFEAYTINNTIIIHPDNAASIEKLFNSIKSKLVFKKYLERVAADSIVNTNRDE